MNQIPRTLEKTVAIMKHEIVSDVLLGFTPLTCATFGELHDYRDANAYGGFCDDEFSDRMINYFGGRDKDEAMPDGFMQYVEQAQDAVDQWLRSGGLTVECPPMGWTAIDLSQDDPWDKWGTKPYTSVYEMRLGGNGVPTGDLTILREGEMFAGAHGSVLMPERFATATLAADSALGWAVENGWKDHAQPQVQPAEPVLKTIQAAVQVVASGLHSGLILHVADGVAIQKIGRSGETVCHDVSKLNKDVKVGEVVEIRYRGGQGEVKGPKQEQSLGR